MVRRAVLLGGLGLAALQAADFTPLTVLSGPIKSKKAARPPRQTSSTSTSSRKRDELSVLEGGEVVPPKAGHKHECTLIYLHGCSCNAAQYLEDGWELPWTGQDRWPGLRTVLPDAKVMRQPWGDLEPSWHAYVGDFSTLNQTRDRLAHIVYSEVERLHGEGHRVFLGGASQGCTVALDTYLLQARKLLLGGFVGSVGFLPTDRQGFRGATRALEKLINSHSQRHRPLWLQCATDDDELVPWRTDVKPSLHAATGRLPGLHVKEVTGRGHILDEWEGEFVRKFLEAHATFQ
ncbi:unnamed protein product [Durusdinium trenchii]|uniref:Phospholipase/carboxylesterase/thioesterase domain-containing protein n=1 Tax=Durusdinium trenchii TaxID=1381693 RepID=A0ABP0P7W6_9DINO